MRFGNDRLEINSKWLSLLDPSTKPVSKGESEGFKSDLDWGDKKVDDMDPKNWDE